MGSRHLYLQMQELWAGGQWDKQCSQMKEGLKGLEPERKDVIL